MPNNRDQGRQNHGCCCCDGCVLHDHHADIGQEAAKSAAKAGHERERAAAQRLDRLRGQRQADDGAGRRDQQAHEYHVRKVAKEAREGRKRKELRPWRLLRQHLEGLHVTGKERLEEDSGGDGDRDEQDSARQQEEPATGPVEAEGAVQQIADRERAGRRQGRVRPCWRRQGLYRHGVAPFQSGLRLSITARLIGDTSRQRARATVTPMAPPVPGLRGAGIRGWRFFIALVVAGEIGDKKEQSCSERKRQQCPSCPSWNPGKHFVCQERQ